MPLAQRAERRRRDAHAAVAVADAAAEDARADGEPDAHRSFRDPRRREERGERASAAEGEGRDDRQARGERERPAAGSGRRRNPLEEIEVPEWVERE